MKKIIEFDSGDSFDNANVEEKIKKALQEEGYISDADWVFAEKDFALVIEIVEKL